MKIGIPKEIKDNEKRVSVTPFGVAELVNEGNIVYVERNAGIGSGYSNQNYKDSGAILLDSAESIFDSSKMIVKVKEPLESEIKLIKSNHIIFTFFHFAADEIMTKSIIDTGCISMAYETVQLDDGSLPILTPMSEVAGRMSIQNGAKCLEGSMGGKGKLLGGVPGVEKSIVTIIGGGIVGTNAAKLAAGLGADVYILDIDMNRLRYLNDVMPSNVTTLYSNSYNLDKLISETDLFIGAVLIPGKKAPNLITKQSLKKMQEGSVIVDVAVDQGGCVETCKPTTHNAPTYIVDDIVHYCVANMPGAVPYTSTLALTNVTLPYIKELSTNSTKDCISYNNSLKLGLNTFNGHVTHRAVAESFNLNYSDPLSLI